MNATTWTPPADPNPQDILQTARGDTNSGAYEDALVKFLWFHEHALQIDPGLTGVRLSFAVSYWLKLARVYPPALEAFFRTRDQAETAFREGPADFDLFAEIAALNEYVGQRVRTADLFEEVANTNPAGAQRIYHVAERSLVADRRYKTCGPFLRPQKRMALAAEQYHSMRQFEDSRPETKYPPPKVARKFYVQDVATLIALLVINGQNEEARHAYHEGLSVVNDFEFQAVLDAAVRGELPYVE